VTSSNGEGTAPHGPLELNETLYIQTKDGAALPFEVVGILEDQRDGASYAVLLHEPTDAVEGEFIVTDLLGNLLNDDRLAQEIVEDFLLSAEESE
jgi:hypothetical protein